MIVLRVRITYTYLGSKESDLMKWKDRGGIV